MFRFSFTNKVSICQNINNFYLKFIDEDFELGGFTGLHFDSAWSDSKAQRRSVCCLLFRTVDE